MELFLFWAGLSVIVGILAHNRGRVGFGWFVLSLVLSPLLMGLLVLVLRDLSRQSPPPPSVRPAETAVAARILLDDTPTTRCPECRELVRADARKCKHCGSALVPQQ